MSGKKGPSFIGFSGYKAGNISVNSSLEGTKIQEHLKSLKYLVIESDIEKNVMKEVVQKTDTAISSLQNRDDLYEDRLVNTLKVIKEIYAKVEGDSVLRNRLKNIVVDILKSGKEHSNIITQKVLVEIASQIMI